MPVRPKRPCTYPGCPKLTDSRYCPEHTRQERQRYDRQRGTAAQRGYDGRWQRYTKWFLQHPDNVFCKLQLQGCANVSQCVDHIDPPDGPNDPRFWDPENHQGVCIHCNSDKGKKKIKGEAEPFSAGGRGR